MRCHALVQAWLRAGGRAVLVGRVEPSALADKLARAGLPCVTPDRDDADGLGALLCTFAEKCDSRAANWCVLDGYGFGPGLQAAIRREGRRLLVVDDLALLPRYHADMILNQNPSAPGLTYHADPGATLLLGPDYALLREEFLTLPPRDARDRNRVRKVLVTMGGSDPDNITAFMLDALACVASPGLEVAVVAGPANPHVESLKHALERAPFAGRLAVDPPDLPARMAEADVAVTAGGSTCLELCALGVPLAVTLLAANQAPGTAALTEAGAAMFLGPAQGLSAAAVGAGLAALFADAPRRAAMSQAGRRLVDRRGADRVVARLLQGSEQRLRLRPAMMRDAEFLLACRNDPVTVRAGYASHTVAPGEHRRWLAGSLDNPHRSLYLAEVNGIPAGSLRVDSQDGENLLSWTVAPACRGRGVGKAMVRLAVDSLDGPVRAEIKIENLASARIAEAAGLVPDPTRNKKGIQCYVRPARQGHRE